VRDWLLLIGTTLEVVVVAGAAAVAAGLWLCVVACIAGGWCVAQRDHIYQEGQRRRAAR